MIRCSYLTVHHFLLLENVFTFLIEFEIDFFKQEHQEIAADSFKHIFYKVDLYNVWTWHWVD